MSGGYPYGHRALSADPQVAVFDTAYHQSIPPRAYHYALPRRFYEDYGIRRYGFHGTSHQYVAGEACRLLGKTLDSTNLINLHLGNGASITAIADGQSMDTSMGMTPLAGVIMGTRCGDIDPAIVSLVAEQQGIALADVMEILSKESGLKGICGENDLRDIHRQSAAGNARSKLALELLVYRYKQDDLLFLAEALKPLTTAVHFPYRLKSHLAPTNLYPTPKP